jgi:hypothetical protein
VRSDRWPEEAAEILVGGSDGKGRVVVAEPGSGIPEEQNTLGQRRERRIADDAFAYGVLELPTLTFNLTEPLE